MLVACCAIFELRPDVASAQSPLLILPSSAPLDVPAPRLAALQKAFVDTATNPAFIKEVKARGGSVELYTADETRRLVEKIYATPEDIVKTVKSIVNAR